MDIFISYRRSDSPDVSGRIYDELAHHFGAETVFKDVDDIPLGVNFESYLHDTIQQSSVMLIVIGQDWLDVTDEHGQRRLDQPEDFVRIEVQAALEREIPIVPLLVQGASMPRKSDLPAELSSLALYNGTRIRPDPDFHTDMARLIRQLEPRVRSADAAAGRQASQERRASWGKLLAKLTARPWVFVIVWFCVNVGFLLALNWIVETTESPGGGIAAMTIAYAGLIIVVTGGVLLWRNLRRRAFGPAWAVLAIAALWAVLAVLGVISNLLW